MSKSEPIIFTVSENIGKVRGLFGRPDHAFALLVLAHGAGAGMQHPFMEEISGMLARLGIATFRYQFPYMEQGKKRPDPPRIAQAAVVAAVQTANSLAQDLPLFAGGKSFGGRMTSSAVAHEPLPQVKGLVFLGFPLHPPGKPSSDRASHLQDVKVPMLFLQGTRDALARQDLVKTLCQSLGPKATLKIMEGGDHSFKVLKKTGKSHEQVMQELANLVKDWIGTIIK